MNASFRPRKVLCCLLSPAILLAAGCTDEDPTEPNGGALSEAVQAGLGTFHRATEAYLNIEAAIEDGFVPGGACEDPPGPGAIGIPYVHPERLDTNIDLEQPEILFYEPQQNGELRLVGGEPAVPISLWDEAESEPPSLYGLEFHRNEEHGLYGLHMWVWRYNPGGVFAFGNPNVSCEFASAAAG